MFSFHVKFIQILEKRQSMFLRMVGKNPDYADLQIHYRKKEMAYQSYNLSFK